MWFRPLCWFKCCVFYNLGQVIFPFGEFNLLTFFNSGTKITQKILLSCVIC